MNKITLLVVYTFLAFTTSQYAENMEVSLEQGQVRGFLSDDGRRYSFLGIPYATVPKGVDRYKAPLPPGHWTATMNATDIVMCTQIYFTGDGSIVGTEDCLVVNIFIPVSAQVHKALPVLTFIHGGGFYLGFGDDITTNRLLDNGMIIVTLNYRLGALGFLCLGTEDIPGNAGLKDQVAALRWIKNNIAKFGGNPEDVTLYGSSAGSISVDILSLSRSAEGLFHRIILESGVGLGWIGHDPIGAAKSIAEVMGYSNVEDVDELAAIYKRATVHELVEAVHQNTFSYQPFLLSPCVERDLDGSAIITDSPMNIMQTGNFTPVPAIVAYMEMEGLMFLSYWNLFGWNTTFHENFAEFVLPIFSFESESERNEVAENMKSFYLKRYQNDMLAFVHYQTDAYFFYSSVTNAILRSALSAPVYLIEFSHHDSTTSLGADHSDMYLHVFEIWLRGSGGELAADRITTIFGNFVKYGEPVPSTSELLPVAWPRVTSAAVNYISFADKLSIRQSPQPERYQLWSDFYDKYYTNPSPPNNEPGSGSAVSASVYSIVLLLCISACYNNIW